jgi:membrane-bound lytic murein transglycosylase D
MVALWACVTVACVVAGCATSPPERSPATPVVTTVATTPEAGESVSPAPPPQVAQAAKPPKPGKSAKSAKSAKSKSASGRDSGTAGDSNPPPPLAEAPIIPIAPTTVSQLTPDRYNDLFDRMRAGFAIPFDNRAAIDVELNWFANNPDYLERTFGRAELYLYHIVKEVEARGMPLEIALLPVIESAFEPYAYSSASAVGLWQFIPDTGSRYGLRQNWWYDGRRDVVESTRAALDYLQAMHDEFNGDWLLAIAGYNCGEKCIERAIRINQANGLPIDFWSLRLPVETRTYVPKLLAMRRLVANPADFGIAISPIPNEPYFKEVQTGGQIDLKVAAELAGITYEELYELNPAYHRWATDPAGPSALLLPCDSADVFRQNLELLNPDERMRVTHYRVRKNDTLATVARRFHTQPHVVRELNNLGATERLVVDSDLRVPSGSSELPVKAALAAARFDSPPVFHKSRRPVIHIVRAGDSLYAIARRHRMDVQKLASLNGMQAGDSVYAGQHLVVKRFESRYEKSVPPRRTLSYTVRRGDTLSRIARMFQVTIAQIMVWNDMASEAALRAGQRLKINIQSSKDKS